MKDKQARRHEGGTRQNIAGTPKARSGGIDQNQPDRAEAVPGTFQMIPLGDIQEHPDNPRKTFIGVEELAENIKQVGVLQPILVRDLAESETECIDAMTLRYQLICGARRYRASKQAGLKEIPAIIKSMDDAAVLRVMILEMDKHENVPPLEQAKGYQLLIDKAGFDVAAIAADAGRSESYVLERLQLTKLIPSLQKLLKEGTIGFTHARVLARLPVTAQEEIVKDGALFDWNEKVLTIHELQQHIDRQYHLDLHSASFNKSDATLLPKAGACESCPKRTGFNPALFPEIKQKDICTDRVCFQTKVQAQVRRVDDELTAKRENFLRVSTNYSISSYERQNDQFAGVVFNKDYEEISAKEAKKDPEGVSKALVVHGHNPGRIIHVRIQKEGQSSNDDGARQRKAEARRRRVQTAINERILEEILLHIDHCDVEAFRRLVINAWNACGHDVRVVICRRHGWTKPPKTDNWSHAWMDKAALEYIQEMDDMNDLHKLAEEFALAGGCIIGSYATISVGADLKEAAQFWKVDIERVSKAVKEELKEKEKSKKPKSAGKSGKKKTLLEKMDDGELGEEEEEAMEGEFEQ